MKQNNRAIAQLGQPRFEVVPYGIVRMQPVDVQQVDGAILELGEGVVEGRSYQSRERPEMKVVKARPFLEDVLAIQPALVVALPGVNRVAGGIEPEVLESPVREPRSCSRSGYPARRTCEGEARRSARRRTECAESSLAAERGAAAV